MFLGWKRFVLVICSAGFNVYTSSLSGAVESFVDGPGRLSQPSEIEANCLTTSATSCSLMPSFGLPGRKQDE